MRLTRKPSSADIRQEMPSRPRPLLLLAVASLVLTLAATAVAGAQGQGAAAAGSAFPIRAAFYYPWFPDAWDQQGINPFTKYKPSLGYYDSTAPSVMRAHLRALEYAHVEAGIWSWWGRGSKEDLRLPGMLAETNASGSPMQWTLYHEREGYVDPTPAHIAADLDHIWDNFASDPAYLRVGGRPVIFVYGDPGDGCGMPRRWDDANQGRFHVVLKVFHGYRDCAHQPDSWHQYAPSSRKDQQAGYSFSISPEFDLTGPEAPRLRRSLYAFKRAVEAMVTSGEPWQLVTTFNEWGENTAVESAQQWATKNGFGQYLKALAAVP
jgi:hypothetical protein